MHRDGALRTLSCHFAWTAFSHPFLHRLSSPKWIASVPELHRRINSKWRKQISHLNSTKCRSASSKEFSIDRSQLQSSDQHTRHDPKTQRSASLPPHLIGTGDRILTKPSSLLFTLRKYREIDHEIRRGKGNIAKHEIVNILQTRLLALKQIDEVFQHISLDSIPRKLKIVRLQKEAAGMSQETQALLVQVETGQVLGRRKTSFFSKEGVLNFLINIFFNLLE
ncbi:hypothetical protein EV356DRAFT_21731 [Viridothelium virens]|uniref:Uncharacterized protein n=1 Tax=Viridothelium virens TaxID=1048519 RepID=A0A6A6GU47_VIRVR|nr:hypothetical protein EV356DRAFT_21731 [Viridothelium virens]